MHRGKPTVFNMPSALAILLGISHEAYLSWQRLNPLLTGGSLRHARAVFDTLGAGMTAVITGFNTVEAAVNEAFPDGATYDRPRKKGGVDRYDRARITRKIGLEEKLIKVWPRLTGGSDPSLLPIWGESAKLHDLRHRVIHPKPEDNTHWNVQLPIPTTLWSLPLDPSMSDPAQVAKALMIHLCGTEPPHWVKYAPF
jgi:hypothetical protein